MLDIQDSVESLVTSHLQDIAFVVLYWDYVITFADEVNFIWTTPRSLGSICFFLNRYLAILGNIPIVAFGHLALNESRCTTFAMYHQLLIVANQLIVGFMLVVRVYALYGRDRRLFLFLVLLAVVCVGLALVSVLAPRIRLPLSCPNPPMSLDAAVKTSAAWFAMLVFDLVIFGLTFRKSWMMTKKRGYRMRIPLLHVVLRDGAVYFGVISIANLANILTFFLLGPRLRGSLSTFVSSVSVSMISRLMINLHKSHAGIMSPARQSRTEGSYDAGGSGAQPPTEGSAYLTTLPDGGSMSMWNDVEGQWSSFELGEMKSPTSTSRVSF